MLIDFRNWTEGLYTDVSIHNVPSGAKGSPAGLFVMDNVITTYRVGSILKRPGYSIIGSALETGKSITGLHNFRQSATTQKMLATVNDGTDDDTQLFYSTGGAWSEIAAGETAWANKANINVEMADFDGYCYIVGYGSTDGFIAPRTLTGTTLGTTNTTDMPNAKYITRYRDRLYIANTDISGTPTRFRLYYSSVPSSGTITWNTSTQFLDVDYSEDIKGIAENWDRLFVFTEYSAYMVTNPPIEKKKVWDVGCSSHRSIKNSGQYMLWANRDGVFMSKNGSDPVNISGRVADFIRFSNMTTCFAEIVDEEYHLYIGSVTVNGVSYSNCSLVFNIPTMTWRVHEYYDSMSIFGKFYSSGQDFLWMGTTTGSVHQLGKYTDATLKTSDNGQPIHSWFQTGAFDFGTPAEKKELKKLFAYSDRAQGLMLYGRVVNMNNQGSTEWRSLGELKEYINEFSINPESGNFLQIEGVENGTNPYWSFFGMTFDVNQDGGFN